MKKRKSPPTHFLHAAVFLACLVFGLSASAVTLEWDPSPEPEVAGYRVYIGTVSRGYVQVFDVGASTSYPLLGMEPGQTYYMAVTAYAVDGLESDFSDEVTYTRQIDGTNTFVIPMTLNYTGAGCSPSVTFANDPAREFFVQASTNLVTWQTFQNVIGATNEMVALLDPDAPQFPIRFYRVVSAR
ncbi:MAG TPA: fibronectin type III domain-containing protein [Candidatus Acidoferrum sp.]|nr:fibronectin type III domain-containing protein [Candidatus Acidoferrum sp.]